MRRGDSMGDQLGWRLGTMVKLSAGLLALAAAIALAACETQIDDQVPPPPQQVEIPIAQPVYCDAPKMSRPGLPIGSLTESSSPAETIRAYAASIALLKGAVSQRDEIIAGCSRPEKDQARKGN